MVDSIDLVPKDYPHDGALGWLGRWYYDAAARPWPWYLTNHGGDGCMFPANLQLCIQREPSGGDGRPIVYWTALRDIERGEELFFDYGEPDESWMVGAVGGPAMKKVKTEKV